MVASEDDGHPLCESHRAIQGAEGLNAAFDCTLFNSKSRCHTNQGVVLVIADLAICHSGVDEIVDVPPVRLGDVRVGEPTFMGDELRPS